MGSEGFEVTQESPEGVGDITQHSRPLLGGKGRLILIGIVLALAVVYLVYAAFPGSTSYYFTVDELAVFDGEVEGRNFRVKGALVPESFVREEGGTKASFALTAGGELLPATYDGVVPDLFFNSNSEIILHGQYGDHGAFHAETISVLCPTKYEALEEATT